MLKVNSKKIEKGDTFIAIKSVVRDGHDYIEDAIDRGAVCIIAERGEYSVKTIIVKDTRKYLADYLKELYKEKLEKIKIIGITGTNGKTTSSYFIYQLLNNLGIKTAYIGTIGFYLNKKHVPLKNTTPDLYDLYEMMIEAADNEVEVIVMEVSSQALEARRVEGIRFNIAAFTNITEDHLDYHKTMNDYKMAKQKLFNNIKDYAIINMDSKDGKDFINPKNKNVLFGVKENEYKIGSIKLFQNQTTFKINHNNEIREITLPVPGIYNIHNYMNAYIICDKMEINPELIIKETLNLKSPKGRYELIKDKVIIDYAHTPDAVENILKSVLQYAKGRVLTLIGCGGDRDKKKRPLIGKIATKYSDYVYFTSDNPRTEDPNDIINDMISKVEKNNYEVIIEREDAIKKGISELKKDDILLVLGKGHEEYQIIGKEKFPFNDTEIVKKYLK